jgi:hypothetical protein
MLFKRGSLFKMSAGRALIWHPKIVQFNVKTSVDHLNTGPALYLNGNCNLISVLLIKLLHY